jgi:DNA-binding HxlR family transcriptional regulator
MFDYGEACPISMATSVLCERWTLQIIRELLFGATRFSEIQKFIPNISPSLLRNRLRFLEDQGIIIRSSGGGTRRPEYHLTPAGKALAPVLTEMGKWGMRWAREGMTDKQNTAAGLLRDLAGAVNVDELPGGDTIIQITLTDVEGSPKQYINIQDGTVQACDQDLGFDVTVYITSTLSAMNRVWYGELPVSTAIERGEVQVVAPPVYTRNISRWLGISTFTTDNPSLAPD